MSVSIYSTLTRSKQPFTTIEPGKVTMYCCGVTVYDNCHLGHARSYIGWDVVRRYLQWRGYQVRYVQNFTDIDDKILELSATTQLSDYVSAIAWSPIDNTLAAACCNGEVHLLKSFVGMMLCPPTDNSLAKPSLGEIDALAFSHDGKWLAAGGLDGNISLWRIDGDVPELVDTNAQAHPLRVVETGSLVYRLVWSPTCNHLAFNLGKSVQIWDADRSEVVTNLSGAATPQDLRWSPDGQHLAVATMNDIHIWNSHNWDARIYQWELNSPASTLAWSPDGAYLACDIHMFVG